MRTYVIGFPGKAVLFTSQAVKRQNATKLTTRRHETRGSKKEFAPCYRQLLDCSPIRLVTNGMLIQDCHGTPLQLENFSIAGVLFRAKQPLVSRSAKRWHALFSRMFRKFMLTTLVHGSHRISGCLLSDIFPRLKV